MPLHPTRLIVASVPDEPVRVGATFHVGLKADCELGCSLPAIRISIAEPNASTREVDATASACDVELTAPSTVGLHSWTFNVAAAGGAARHASSLVPLFLDIAPHIANLAVWSLPDAAVAGRPFTVCAGASSTSGPAIAGQKIEILGASGKVVGRGALGCEPWQGTQALFWTEISIEAPLTPQVARYAVHLPTADMAMAHIADDFDFTVPISAEPQHSIEVLLVDRATGLPLGDAVVRAGSVRGTTDRDGRATLRIAEGNFDLIVWKAGYDLPTLAFTAGSVGALLIEGVALPEDDPDAHWKA